MRSFQRSLPDFDARRVRVVAISVDPPDITRALCREQGYTFTFLSDPRAEAVRSYDLLHEGAGPDGGDIARPAEFLIDASGTVRWVHLSESIAVRTRPAEVLAAAEALAPAGSTSR